MDMEVFQTINEYLHSFTVPVVMIRLLRCYRIFQECKKAGSRI